MKKIITFILCLSLALFSLCGCAKQNENTGGTADNTADNTEIMSSEAEENAQNTLSNSFDAPDMANAETLDVSKGDITVTSGGTYIITGSTESGRVIVNAPKEEVALVFRNANITCTYSSALYIYKSKETRIYLPENSESTLTDGTTYTFADELSSSEDNEPNACLYSKSDLVIYGSGTLNVNGNYNNGITGKDTLNIADAKITVTAKNNGINGKDYLAAKNAEINVTSGGDGLRSTNDTDTTLGYISLENTAVNITSAEDGMQAETVCLIKSGIFKIVSGGGAGGKISSDASAKGIKAGSLVEITGGTFTLDCADDAIHSNGNVSVSGGEFDIKTGDDGIHADETSLINGGTINISKCYEGIEGSKVNITGGEISIVASDDGINAAGGRDESGFGAFKDRFSSNSSDCGITVNGGKIYVDASGDGLDSNGFLNVTGGEIYVDGPTSDGDSAFDYDGSAAITGGTVIAAGSSGMAQNFGSNSTQGSILLNVQGAANSEIKITDKNGSVLASFIPSKKYSCAIISCPDLNQGETYTVTAGGSKTSVTLDSLIYGSGQPGGGQGGPMNGGGQNGNPMNGGNRPDNNGGQNGNDRPGSNPQGRK